MKSNQSAATMQETCSGYYVRRPNRAEYFLGESSFVVTDPHGQTQTVTWRSTSVGVVWNQCAGSLIEIGGEVQHTFGDVNSILAAMQFISNKPAAFQMVPAPTLRPNICIAREEFCKQFPHRRSEYVAASRAMFQAAQDAGLDTKGEGNSVIMCEVLCALLSINISSPKQLTPDEMIRAAQLFEAGVVKPGWEIESEINYGE